MDVRTMVEHLETFAKMREYLDTARDRDDWRALTALRNHLEFLTTIANEYLEDC